jgi:hypothetical protein
MFEWRAHQAFGHDENNGTGFVTLDGSDLVKAGNRHEHCHVTVLIPWPEDHSEPSLRQAGLERLRMLVHQGLEVGGLHILRQANWR